jgi:DNA invertase Pin-like site-specific DNA recombinase
MANTKAFSYLRVSGKSQIPGDGFPRQRHAIAKYCKSNRIELVAEFMEKGVRGSTELEDREALAELCKRLDSNGVRLVLVERADRIARDLMVSEVLLQQFRERKVRVIECEGGTELTVADGEPTRVLIRQVLAAVAQFDKSCLVAKLRAARNRIRIATGRCGGPLPYGQLEGEASTVEKIQELRASGLSLQKIVEQLDAEPEKYKTRSGAKWSKTMVKNILDRAKASPSASTIVAGGQS